MITIVSINVITNGLLLKENQTNTPYNYTGFSLTSSLSQSVLQYQGLVQEVTQEEGIPEVANIILAIIQVESGGNLPDVMQSSESQGLPPNTITDPEESIRLGVQAFNRAYQKTKTYQLDMWCAVAGYNYGNAFVDWIYKNGGQYTIEKSEEYSRNVVAPSLGNTTGLTYEYKNAISKKFGKEYLYLNGGNFYYVELVKQYISGGNGTTSADVSGDFKTILTEIEKYQGQPYVWGGKNPSQGFDCSGLVSWGLKQIGINVTAYTVSQYNATVPVAYGDERPGDIIFFKGTYGTPNFVSHVGFYIDANTMYDSNSSGVGYHTWNNAYWKQYSPEVRRIISTE
ncbi:bifunctional lytic transglycosylase/C40 family peptidase [Granulicatella balaenopterae]|nr:bifunctional lysozyme/C40 family peptidase [Granulicatella balaenopterae]